MTFHRAHVVVLLADIRLVKLLYTASMSPVLITFEALNAFLEIHSADYAFLIGFLNYPMYRLDIIVVDGAEGIQLL